MKIATSTRYKQHRRNTLPRTQISTYIAMAETTEELQDSLLKRDEEIRNLNSFLQLKKNQLQQREEEIQQLRSHLDKFQSVLPFGGQSTNFTSVTRTTTREPRKVRAQGISAEPQSLQTTQDINHRKFKDYPKCPRYITIQFATFGCHYFLFYIVVKKSVGILLGNSPVMLQN